MRHHELDAQSYLSYHVMELGDQIVDLMSKGESRQVESIWPQGVKWSGRPSDELRKWIERPRVMMD